MSPPINDSVDRPVAVRCHLNCPICLDLFQEPVTTHCGHSFCKACLDCNLAYNDQTCPLCKEYLRVVNTKVNILINSLIQDFRKAQERSPEEWSPSEGHVPCDVCTDRKLKAVKSCLVCLTSFCKTHLKPHTTAHRLRGHKLVTPVSNLEQLACETHGRPLELYSRTLERCVCALCVEQGHQVVPAETEWDRKKAELGARKEELEKNIQERSQKVEEITQAVELCRTRTDREKGEIQAVFGAVLTVVKEAEAELLRPLEEKQRDVETQAQEFTQELEREISSLKRKISELDNTVNDEDHVHFLQSFSSVVSSVENKDWSDVAVDMELSLGTMRKVLSDMMEQIHQDIQRLSSTELGRIQKFSVDVRLDPDTANCRLLLSDNGKEVWDGGADRDIPDNPKRFDLFGSVLGHNPLLSGRHYWEVQVGEKRGWDLGVASESTNRKGRINLEPENSYWCIVLYNEDQYAAMTSPPSRLSLTSKPHTVGVYVDYEGGQVSFYDVEARSHIYSFTGYTFTEKLYPYFSPHLNQDNKNSTPLIISAVSQTH